MSGQEAPPTPSWEEKEINFSFVKAKGERLLKAQHNRGDETRMKITHHHNLFGHKVYAGVNKVYWGSYDGAPACLLVVRFRFYYPNGPFRLSSAEITICFNNHPDEEDASRTRAHPVLSVYSPKYVRGPVTESEEETHWDIAARLSVNVGPATVGPEGSRGSSSKWTGEHAVEIAGEDEPEEDKDYPNKVIFTITENKKSRKGVPKELFFGVIVSHDGPIHADVRTSIQDATAWPWSKDDPIILKPGTTFGALPATFDVDMKKWNDESWKSIVPYPSWNANVKHSNTS